MIKNNKGVTLVELLIVIVVMGIIAAFAIPAVGTIIENTNKDAILADAIAIENGAKLYCASTQCTSAESLTWTEIGPFISGVTINNTGGYDFSSTPALAAVPTYDVAVVSRTVTGGDWTVTIEGFNNTGYDFTGVAHSADRTAVTVAD